MTMILFVIIIVTGKAYTSTSSAMCYLLNGNLLFVICYALAVMCYLPCVICYVFINIINIILQLVSLLPQHNLCNLLF